MGVIIVQRLSFRHLSSAEPKNLLIRDAEILTVISLLSGLETKIKRGGGRDGTSEDFEIQEVQFVIKILMYLHRLFGSVELDDKFHVYNSFYMTHVNKYLPLSN